MQENQCVTITKIITVSKHNGFDRCYLYHPYYSVNSNYCSKPPFIYSFI